MTYEVISIFTSPIFQDNAYLDRLIPSTQTPAENTSQDLLPYSQPVVLTLSSHVLDTLLGEPAQAESGTPVCHLPDSDSIDTSVDTRDTILAVDVGEDTEGGLGLDSSGGLLVASDLDRLHTRAETHCSVRLSDTTNDTSCNTGGEVTGAESAGMVPGWLADFFCTVEGT